MEMNNININIANDFSITPGGRYEKDGKFSGEEFRRKLLEPHFINDQKIKITINFDNAEGYSTAFLEEAFGGLVRIYGKDKVLTSIFFISNEDPLLIEEINNYINNARKRAK